MPLNRTSPPALPASWKSPTGTEIWWDTAREHFTAFMQKINNYCDGNNIGRPSEAEVEAQVCAQFPAWACAEPSPAPFPQQNVTHRAGGCSCCGRR